MRPAPGVPFGRVYREKVHKVHRFYRTLKYQRFLNCEGSTEVHKRFTAYGNSRAAWPPPRIFEPSRSCGKAVGPCLLVRTMLHGSARALDPESGVRAFSPPLRIGAESRMDTNSVKFVRLRNGPIELNVGVAGQGPLILCVHGFPWHCSSRIH